jgi:hypothetical protein
MNFSGEYFCVDLMLEIKSFGINRDLDILPYAESKIRTHEGIAHRLAAASQF